MSPKPGLSHPFWGTQALTIYLAASNDWPHGTQSTAYKPSRTPRATVESDGEVYACLQGSTLNSSVPIENLRTVVAILVSSRSLAAFTELSFRVGF